jgi:outer membrane lipoprotein
MMKLITLLFVLLLTACSTLPPEIREAPLYDLSYYEAVRNMAQFKTAPVRWGGVIVDVANEPDRSLLQVLYYPLDNGGSPLTDKLYQGRFVGVTPQFLDPAIYTQNTHVTISGTLVGDIERTVDKKTLRVPLITIDHIYLWPDYPANNYSYGGFGMGYGTFNSFYGYPAWGFYRPMIVPMR